MSDGHTGAVARTGREGVRQGSSGRVANAGRGRRCLSRARNVLRVLQSALQPAGRACPLRLRAIPARGTGVAGGGHHARGRAQRQAGGDGGAPAAALLRCRRGAERPGARGQRRSPRMNPYFFTTPVEHRNLWTGTLVDSPAEAPVFFTGRLLSLLCGAATLVFVYLFLRLFLPGPVSLLGAALLAFIPQFVYISTSFSNDMASVLTAQVGLWQLGVAAKQGLTLRRGVLLGVLVALALMAKLGGLALLAPLGVLALWQCWRERRIAPLAGGGAGGRGGAAARRLVVLAQPAALRQPPGDQRTADSAGSRAPGVQPRAVAVATALAGEVVLPGFRSRRLRAGRGCGLCWFRAGPGAWATSA